MSLIIVIINTHISQGSVYCEADVATATGVQKFGVNVDDAITTELGQVVVGHLATRIICWQFE